MMMASMEPPSHLIGREAELGVLDQLIDAVPTRGAALVLLGEPGIGKSALIDHAQAVAESRGMGVLKALGVQSEADLPFSGLHQLLRPLAHRFEDLPGPQRAALLAAFGMAEAAARDSYLTSLATLTLLSEHASSAPVVMVADDVQWLDRSTRDVLGFVARRLESDPILFVAGLRSGADNPFAGIGLHELALGPLSPNAAEGLLEAQSVELEYEVRKRVL